MNSKVATDFAKLVLITGAIGLAIFVIIRFGFSDVLPKDESTLISVDSELKLGELIAENLIENNQNDLYEGALADSALWVISSRLLKNLDSSNYDYQFKILDNPEVNAFTIPGGRIYTFKGLISFAETPEELAAVLAHEMGHAQKRHVVDKLAKEFGLTIMFSIISGGDPLLINDFAQAVLSSAFDRKQEEEADDFALKLLEKSGINPDAMASFFRKLNRENLSYNESLEMVMSHVLNS